MNAVSRSQRLRAMCRFIPETSCRMRKEYFTSVSSTFPDGCAKAGPASPAMYHRGCLLHLKGCPTSVRPGKRRLLAEGTDAFTTGAVRGTRLLRVR
jgi:hypothetical protein